MSVQTQAWAAAIRRVWTHLAASDASAAMVI